MNLLYKSQCGGGGGGVGEFTWIICDFTYFAKQDFQGN